MLTELQVRKVQAKDKVYTLSDGDGLLLYVHPTGAKTWIARIWIDGRETRRSIGQYPAMGLREAREKNAALRGKGSAGVFSFRALAEEFFERRVDGKQASADKKRYRLDKYILPYLGNRELYDISSADVLAILRPIEDAGVVETAHRVRQLVGQIFRYGIATGRVQNDPTVALRGALATPKVRHYATFTRHEDIRRLIVSIDGYREPLMRLALWLSALTFARPGEIRAAQWDEFDLERQEWRIHRKRTKMEEEHVVPLADETMEIVKGIEVLTGGGKYLFPSARSSLRPMSENAIRAALRTLGFSNDDFTPHGFRAMASTVLNEHGWPVDVIERQLAHAERNKVRAAYNRAEYLPQRREMMAWWGSWLDSLSQKDC